MMGLALGSLLVVGASVGWAQLPPPPTVADKAQAAPDAKPTTPPPMAPATSEPSAKSSTEPQSPPVARPVQEAPPPLYYLRDKSGNLVPVPGFRLEDFEQMVKRQYGPSAAEQAPRYALQAFQATGKAQADWVELQVRLNLVTREEGWIRVPLRLDQAVLRSGVQYEGSGEHFVQFDSGGDGYVFWVRGGTEREHHLTLDLMVPVVRLGAATRMKLVVPRAATSELKLVVPLADAVAKVTEGPILLPSTPEGKTATVLNLAGLGGEFELSWGKEADRPSETQPVLDVAGTIQWKVGSRSLDGEVRMQVRSFGAPFDAFQVRLPQGTELVPVKTAPYTLSVLKPAQPAAEERAVVEVRLPKKTVGPVEVQLAARLAWEAAGAAAWAEIASFEVPGAARQAGHVAIRADSQWRVLVGPLRGARQVDELPKALRTDDVAAAFEYYTQPCALPIRVVRRSPRISVEPEYLVLVDADQVRLEARLKYMIRAAEVAALDIDLPGWELDELGPENLVATDLVVDPSGLRSIPLAQRSIGPLELTLRAHRPIPPGSQTVAIELPRPRADSQASPVVVLLPADNVELTPDPQGMVGLVRQQVAPQMKLPVRQQDPFFYRAEPSKAKVVAHLRVHPQKVSVAVSTEIAVDEHRAEVRQKMAYQVAYKAVDRLSFEVPRSLASVEPLSVLFEGRTLRLVDAPDPNDEHDVSRPARKQVILPESRIGACELAIRYAVELPGLVPRSSVAASIPLVMPAEGELSGNRLWIAAPEGIRVRPRGGPWTEAAAPVSELRRGLHLTAAERVREIDVAVHLEDQSSAGSTVVNRAWIQTWLTHSLRQDRAVFCLTTSQKSLDLVLPVGVSPGEVELWLDGQPITGQPTPELRLIVSLSGAGGQREHRLEAAYRIPGPRPGWGRMSLELPRLARDVWVQRLYWQLILPGREHLLFAPPGLSEENRWVWQGPLCVREPLWEQSQLEAWAGARQLAEPPAETNRYLFSGIGSMNRCDVRTVDRTFLVFGASMAVLAAGLLLVYVPASRHPAGLLVAALAAAAAAVVYPSPTLLLAQASLLGVALALGAAWLHGALARQRRAAARETPSSILERGSSRSSRRAVAMASGPLPAARSEEAPVSTTDFRA